MRKNTKKDYLEVSWAFGVSPTMNIDFGQFPAHKENKILVDRKFWNKYCDMRFEFETMHKRLVEMINK